MWTNSVDLLRCTRLAVQIMGEASKPSVKSLRARYGAIIPTDWVAKASFDIGKAFALAVLSDDKATEHTAEKALMAIVPGCLRWAQNTRQAVSARLLQRQDVATIISRHKDELLAAGLLGRNERRHILASIARTEQLCDQPKASDVINATRLDAELAGDLVKGQPLVQVNIGQTLKDLPIETRVNAILLADSACLLD